MGRRHIKNKKQNMIELYLNGNVKIQHQGSTGPSGLDKTSQPGDWRTTLLREARDIAAAITQV